MPIDYSKYPSDWKSGIVPRILKRANHKCEFCGIENKSKVTSIPIKITDGMRNKIKRFWITNQGDIARMSPFSLGGDIKEITVVLTIAHLDHDEENHDVEDSRLAALCQSCHLNYDIRNKTRRIMAKSKQETMF